MQNLIQTLSENVIEEAQDNLDQLVHWALDSDDIEYSLELEEKVKQQILFTLIKRLTK